MMCFFDGGHECVALTEKKCKDCKFRKTKEEYFQEQVKAAEILERKNLIAKKKLIGTTSIMSTEFYRRW